MCQNPFGLFTAVWWKSFHAVLVAAGRSLAGIEIDLQDSIGHCGHHPLRSLCEYLTTDLPIVHEACLVGSFSNDSMQSARYVAIPDKVLY